MIVEMDPTIVSASVQTRKIRVTLRDSRDIAIPLRWSPRLVAATTAQRRNVMVVEEGRALRRPDVDEDIDVSAFLAYESIVVFPPGSLVIGDDGSFAGKESHA